MLARCARCQGTFTTDRFGRQFCPHCGSELILADPNAPAAPPAGATPPEPPPTATGGIPPPPPPGPGWSPPPQIPAAPPPGGPTDPGGPSEGPGLPAPFAERATRGFFQSFFETWKLSAIEPQKFFAHVRTDQVGTAVLFGLLAALAGGAVATLFGLIGNASSLAVLEQMMGKMPAEEAALLRKILPFFGGGMAALQFVILPIWILLRMFLGAAIVHVVLLMFGGAKRGFNATLTVVAFSMGVHLLAAVPLCGGIVAGVWQLVLLVLGLAAIHRTDVWKAAVAVIAPIVLCCCCVGVSVFGTIAAIAGSAAGGGGSSSL